MKFFFTTIALLIFISNSYSQEFSELDSSFVKHSYECKENLHIEEHELYVSYSLYVNKKLEKKRSFVEPEYIIQAKLDKFFNESDTKVRNTLILEYLSSVLPESAKQAINESRKINSLVLILGENGNIINASLNIKKDINKYLDENNICEILLYIMNEFKFTNFKKYEISRFVYILPIRKLE